jgi:hypothetical protein
VVVERGACCPHCGQSTSSGRVVTFDHTARLQHTPPAIGVRDAPDQPGSPTPADAPLTVESIAWTDGQLNEAYDPRVLLVFLIPFVPLLIGMTVARHGDAGVLDLACQMICRAITVGVQYAVLREVSGERLFVVVLALQMAASLSPAQPGTQDLGLFPINFVLMLAGLQALGVAAVRLWRAPRVEGADPRPDVPGELIVDRDALNGGLEPSTSSHAMRGGGHADDAV